MEITREHILEAVRATGTTSSFCSNQTYLTKKFGRKPTRLERLVLTTTLKELNTPPPITITTTLSCTSTVVERSECVSESVGVGVGVGDESKLMREEVELLSKNILVCTAYSSDYTIGSLCELVNEEYAKKHGYDFLSVVMRFEDMMTKIQPRQHCAWFKALLILNILQRCHGNSDSSAPEHLPNLTPHSSRTGDNSTDKTMPPMDDDDKEKNKRRSDNELFSKYQYILWIDADAVIIDHDKTVQSFLQQAVSDKCDILISEDMGGKEGGSTCCPINTGVMLIRVSEWNLSLWTEVWYGHAAKRFYQICYHEQSTLVKCLRARDIDLEERLNLRIKRELGNNIETNENRSELPSNVINTLHNLGIDNDGCRRESPSHGAVRRQYPPHVCILKSLSWNSNVIPSESCSGADNIGAQFIFHAVGNWNKGQVLYDVILNRKTTIWQQLGDEILSESDNKDRLKALCKLDELSCVTHNFRLVRGVGRVRNPESVDDNNEFENGIKTIAKST